jgi:hypothetical protein
MAAFSIVEHLDVLKQVGPGFLARPIANTVHAFSLENAEEALDGGIVIAVTGTAHAACDAVLSLARKSASRLNSEL